MVGDFSICDDISHQAPGIKDIALNQVTKERVSFLSFYTAYSII
jgi:hypothetical protein